MLLAIDSATRMLSLALHDGERLRCETAWETANQHTVELAPAIQAFCARAGITMQMLTRIAVCQGPGSFSGLRIGIATAKGLSMALRLSLTPIPTLDITAGGIPHPATFGEPYDTLLVAIAPAGRSRVCIGMYQWADGWQAASPVEIIAWEPLLKRMMQHPGQMLLGGEFGLEAGQLQTLLDSHASRSQITVVPAAFCLRRAGVLADLAWKRPALDPATVAPIYVNQPGLPHP